jgi:putative FmdB family regulatory protein
LRYEDAMPIYEYICKTCETKFEELVRDREVWAARCPKCGTAEVNRLLSLFATNNNAGARASEFSTNGGGHCCGGMCGCRSN